MAISPSWIILIPVTAAATRLRLVEDAVPGARDLVSDDVPSPIATAYATVGSTADLARPVNVTWWPGTQLTIRYQVQGTGGPLAGTRDVVATAGKIPEGAFIVPAADGADVGVWAVPHDPALPGLPSALDRDAVADLLTQIGIATEPTTLQMRTYRPGRRAVIEVTAGPSRVYLKVVRPSQVEGLHGRHRQLSGRVPIPDSFGLSPELGIVAMPALPGTDLRSVLREGGPVPEPRSIAALVANLPEPNAPMTTSSAGDGLPRLIDLLQRLVPEEEDRVQRLGRAIDTDSGAGRAPVHGDFHAAQVMVSESGLGLIDVDTFGWGRPGDDPATMLAQLDLLAPGSRDPGTVLATARALNQIWDGLVDPVHLRLRTAAVVLGLAVGPFRVQRPRWPHEVALRIAAAERWVQSAHRVHERSLIATSGGSHRLPG